MVQTNQPVPSASATDAACPPNLGEAAARGAHGGNSLGAQPGAAAEADGMEIADVERAAAAFEARLRMRDAARAEAGRALQTGGAAGAAHVADGLALPEGAFVGRESFCQRLRLGFAAAAEQGWREWVLCDRTFGDWPLDDGEVIAALQAWALKGQRLLMLAVDYAGVPRQHPRFARWRQQWTHKVDCLLCARADANEISTLFWSPQWVLQRPEAVPGYGSSGGDAARIAMLREQIDGWAQRGRAGFAAFTLGL